MPSPIILPTVARYKTVLGIGPLPGDVDTIQNIFAVDDNSFAVFTWSGQNPSWRCWVIDVPTLAITYYASTGQGQDLQSPPIPFGPGNFLLLWNDGSTYAFGVRNLKLNNASPILVPFNQGVIATPCYNGVNKIFYCPNQNLVTVGSYYPNGGAGFGPIFTRNYNLNGGALNPLDNGHYSGWYTTAPPSDPWNKTTATGGSAQLASNGINIVFSGGNPTLVSRSSYRLINGTAPAFTCVDAFDGVATASGDHVINDIGTVFNTGTQIAVSGFCDSNIPGLVGLSDENGVHIFGDGGVWFYVPVQFGTIISAALTRNYIAGVISFEGMSIGIYQTPPAGSLYNGNSVTKNTYGLVNFVRAVSVIGKYKA